MHKLIKQSMLVFLAFALVMVPLASSALAQGKIDKENKVYTLPYEIDQDIASVKLNAMGVSIDKLTKEQVAYFTAYDEGT